MQCRRITGRVSLQKDLWIGQADTGQKQSEEGKQIQQGAGQNSNSLK